MVAQACNESKRIHLYVSMVIRKHACVGRLDNRQLGVWRASALTECGPLALAGCEQGEVQTHGRWVILGLQQLPLQHQDWVSAGSSCRRRCCDNMADVTCAGSSGRSRCCADDAYPSLQPTTTALRSVRWLSLKASQLQDVQQSIVTHCAHCDRFQGLQEWSHWQPALHDVNAEMLGPAHSTLASR